MVLQHWWNDDRLNPDNWGKAASHCQCVHYKPQVDWPGIKPEKCGVW